MQIFLGCVFFAGGEAEQVEKNFQRVAAFYSRWFSFTRLWKRKKRAGIIIERGRNASVSDYNASPTSLSCLYGCYCACAKKKMNGFFEHNMNCAIFHYTNVRCKKGGGVGGHCAVDVDEFISVFSFLYYLCQMWFHLSREKRGQCGVFLTIKVELRLKDNMLLNKKFPSFSI